LTGSLLSLLMSCSTSNPDSDHLKVRQFHLRSPELADDDTQMVRGEQAYRLRGAVTMKERKSRLGQYYTVSWKNDSPSGEPMKVVMDYQQATTGSEVHQMKRDLPSGESAGRVEFKVTGNSYLLGGRVLAWRIRLLREGEIIAEKRSYLWR